MGQFIIKFKILINTSSNVMFRKRFRGRHGKRPFRKHFGSFKKKIGKSIKRMKNSMFKRKVRKVMKAEEEIK